MVLPGGQQHVGQCLVLHQGVLPLRQGDRDVFLVPSILRLRPQEVPRHQGRAGDEEVLLLVRCEFLYWIFQTREEDLGE